MILTYHDGGCIKAVAGDTTLVFGPVSKESKKYKPTNFGADIAFVSINHPDSNGVDESSRGDRTAFAITGPGEYEVHGVSAAGFASQSEYNGEERINTVYSVHFDGFSILYAGALIGDIPKDVLEIDSPDILFVPISGNGVLEPAVAQKLAVKLEAKVVIPLYATDSTLRQFLKETGGQAGVPQDKLTIKPKDLAGKENEVVVLV